MPRRRDVQRKQSRARDEDRRRHHMQREDSEVEANEGGVEQQLAQACHVELRFTRVREIGRPRHGHDDVGGAETGQDGHEPEQ